MPMGVLLFFFLSSFCFYLLSSAHDGALIIQKIVRVYGFGSLEKLEKVKNSVSLFIKVWICMIVMCKKKKLKKVGYDREVQK